MKKQLLSGSTTSGVQGIIINSPVPTKSNYIFLGYLGGCRNLQYFAYLEILCMVISGLSLELLCILPGLWHFPYFDV